MKGLILTLCLLVPGRKIVSGHEEVETALVKLYRATGDKRYLDLSYYLLECREDGGEGDTKRQNHKPVRIVKADGRVEALRGRIAVERGPFVTRKNESGFVGLTDTERNLEFVPYYRHAQEGITQMSVWLNENCE
ncbi:MAG: glycoside hydrolase family 127 protein [Bacteroidales bacterium]|nr:glycoside hydrolase family 127 protein [Bacteroidales bacterium]